MIGSNEARNQSEVNNGAGSGHKECVTSQPLREGRIWGRKILAGLALHFADILSTDRSLSWNLAWSRNRRRWEMVSEVPNGKKKSPLN